jgi:hypothetical protein
MKIGHPAKKRVRVSNLAGEFTVFADDCPVIRAFKRGEACRIAVLVRRSMVEDVAAWSEAATK